MTYYTQRDGESESILKLEGVRSIKWFALKSLSLGPTSPYLPPLFELHLTDPLKPLKRIDPGMERPRNGTTPERNDPGTERPRNGTTPERNDPEIIKINSQSLEDATTFHQKSGYHSGLFLVCYKTSNGRLKMSNNKMLNVCITIKYGLQILKC